jgi:hypothetical protein
MRKIKRVTQCVFAFCDYDTLELRSLAHVLIELFGHSAMAEALREGKDLQSWLRRSLTWLMSKF